VAQDLAVAVRYYRLVAKQGYTGGQCNLGNCFAKGKGVAQDEAEAVRHYCRLAAEQGDASAQFNLGCCFASGQGVAQDEADAVRYYRLAADQGHANAQFNLGVCFAKDMGVAQDEAEAVRYYRVAAAQAGALFSEDLVRITAACDRIACSREVASTCCLGCGARRKPKTSARCKILRHRMRRACLPPGRSISPITSPGEMRDEAATELRATPEPRGQTVVRAADATRQTATATGTAVKVTCNE
jgi:hypothetical protein